MNPFAFVGSAVYGLFYYAWPGHWGQLAEALRDPKTLVFWNLSTLATYSTLFPLSLSYPEWARDVAKGTAKAVAEASEFAPVVWKEAVALVGELFMGGAG